MTTVPSEGGYLNYQRIDDYVALRYSHLEQTLDISIRPFIECVDSTQDETLDLLARNVMLSYDKPLVYRSQPMEIARRTVHLGYSIAYMAMPHQPDVSTECLLGFEESMEERYASLLNRSVTSFEGSPAYKCLIERYRPNIDPTQDEPQLVRIFGGLILMLMDEAEKQRAEQIRTQEVTQLNALFGM